MTDQLNELKQLKAQLVASDGWAVRGQLARVRAVGRIFSGNWQELEAQIGRFSSDTRFALVTWGPNGSGLEAFLGVVDRPLHNFLASCSTLVDHMRIISRRLIEDESSKHRYDTRLATHFSENPRSRFVIDFRNYLAHYELPATEGSLSWSRDDGLAHSIQLESARLRKWKGWKPLARQYLHQSGDTIDLYQTLAGYVEEVNEFHLWFGALIVEVHSVAMAEAQEIAMRHDALVMELRGVEGEVPSSQR